MTATIERGGDPIRASDVEGLVRALDELDVHGVERFVAKLGKAVKTSAELNGVLREGVYARQFAECGAKVTFEPKGPKGPDLGVQFHSAYANIEIKRLLDGEPFRVATDVTDWYEDETDPNFSPAGPDSLTDKVLGVIADANSQLVVDEPNMILLSDLSIGVTTGNFRRAIESLQEEIASNGTYGRISAVQYDSNFLGVSGTYLWLNQGAAVPLPSEVAELLRASVRNEAEAIWETIGRTITGGEPR